MESVAVYRAQRLAKRDLSVSHRAPASRLANVTESVDTVQEDVGSEVRSRVRRCFSLSFRFQSRLVFGHRIHGKGRRKTMVSSSAFLRKSLGFFEQTIK